jgi:hypothetical protein
VTTSFHRPKAAFLAPLVTLAGIAALAATAVAISNDSPGAKAVQKPMRLADATMIIEVNSTDGDAGLQVFLDGEPWSEMAVFAPNGRKILDVDATGRLNRFGLPELFSESHEPEFTELPLRRFKKRFPAGRYRFRGTTVEGRRLIGEARFSHDTPAGPEITSPAAGASVPEANVVARWNRGPQPTGVQIAGYRVIVERENPLRVFNADLPASANSVTIPAEFLEPGIEYLLEIQAIERSGNQTISEISFRVT